MVFFEERLIVVFEFSFELLFDILATLPWDFWLTRYEQGRTAEASDSTRWVIPLAGALFGAYP